MIQENISRIDVVPANDKKPHVNGIMCDCEPSISLFDDIIMCTHHAYDAREILQDLGYSEGPEWLYYTQKL